MHKIDYRRELLAWLDANLFFLGGMEDEVFYIYQSHRDYCYFLTDSMSPFYPKLSVAMPSTLLAAYLTLPRPSHVRIPANRGKNRYSDVLCYDHSRVALTQVNDDPNSDYINANYVDGYKQKNAFISSQGGRQRRQN